MPNKIPTQKKNIEHLSTCDTISSFEEVTFSDLLIMRTYIQCFVEKTIKQLNLKNPKDLKTEMNIKIKRIRCIPDINVRKTLMRSI